MESLTRRESWRRRDSAVAASPSFRCGEILCIHYRRVAQIRRKKAHRMQGSMTCTISVRPIQTFCVLILLGLMCPSIKVII
jgi:hypothetical protein